MNQRGATQFIVLLILLGGIAAGVYLLTAGPLKLFSRAVSHPISAPVETVAPSPTPVSAPIVPPPDPGGGGERSRPQPPATTLPQTTKEFRFAESPTDLPVASWQQYAPGTIISHKFLDSSTGQKFIFVQFRDSAGAIVKVNGQDYVSTFIELVEQAAKCDSVTALRQKDTGSVTVQYTGKADTVQIWVASNSEVGKDAPSVQSWTKVLTQAAVNKQTYTFPLSGLTAGSHAILVSLHDASGTMLDGNVGRVVNSRCSSVIDVPGTTIQPPTASPEACQADCKACPAISDRCGNTTYDKCDYSTCTSPDAQYRCYAQDNPNCEGYYRCGSVCGSQ